MALYNWSNLSDNDFEAVCRDVMAAALGSQVEAFARGKDGGVDLRAKIGSILVIGQAKHYLRSTYSSLKNSVSREKSKLDRLASRPGRYILFTSVPLSPARKTELMTICAPYILDTGDVWGVEDIEGALAANEPIEAHHYKLWLSSARVLDRILGNAAKTRSSIRTEDIISRARYYVPHGRIPQAEKLLRQEHCLIISGAPGVGKTTMAEMLALKFLAAGYQLYFVSGVDELESHLRPDEKQVFIYDDFLGRTNLQEAPDTPGQERLFAFMRHVKLKSGKYFILTTREYLYREVYAINDRLRESQAEVAKFLLDVNGYDRLKRAQILYNHLYWTPGISRDDLAEFVRTEGYWPIIDHEHFNPRWIADALNRLAQLPEIEEEVPWTSARN